MEKKRVVLFAVMSGAVLALVSCFFGGAPKAQRSSGAEQVPGWSDRDLAFYTHGSMSTEIIPEIVLRTFIRVYPEIFPTQDLSHLGLIPDPTFGWPIGFSRAKPAHLAGLSSVGINCASCHTAEIDTPGGKSVRVIGTASMFDAEGFFGSIIVATYRTMDPPHMGRFLSEYLERSDPEPDPARRVLRHSLFQAEWSRQSHQIAAAMAADPGGDAGVEPGGLHEISAEELQLTSNRLADGVDLARLSMSMLKLFHNMRAALHAPDLSPGKAPPASGPGRNDAFGALSGALLNTPLPFAPVKYGIMWNVEQRPWVHWDGNTSSPLGRNVLAAVGLGAPMTGNRAYFNFDLIERHTRLTENINPPEYPYRIDPVAAESGRALFINSCIECHYDPTSDRLYPLDEIGTDATRAEVFTQDVADKFNVFLASLESPGYTPPEPPPAPPALRGTQQYLSPVLAGVWARSPYLHNGSVRTMKELLTPPATRASMFRKGTRAFDQRDMGFKDAGPYVHDTTSPGNGNGGHDYGTSLTEDEKRELIEYLKTL